MFIHNTFSFESEAQKKEKDMTVNEELTGQMAQISC